MNMKRSTFVIGLALVALFANTFSAAAYPAELPEISSCNQTTASVDIPARRVDYLRMSNPIPCPVVAGTSNFQIPLTGISAFPDRHIAFKDLQADLLSGDYFHARVENHLLIDARFAAFKDRQAEDRSR